MNLTEMENYFQQLEKVLGNLADEQSFLMIYSLIEQVRQLRAQVDKLTHLNKHYYHTFYNGDFDKMEQDFKYLME